ncbi:Mis18-binding protein 1 [Dissostichus eleginoides]|uniref:Mis18-binding protein 1 n=1 Tax=Dissostichus eleginoides TaxID=100907 RepID=A0AAD9F850_DISEL|nr:Mis18-binding protein 1 [Dissostichus eleginoides]
MTRSFPGLFRSNKNVRSFPKSAKKRTGPKTVRVPFFFLASSSEKTPKPSEELILLQAGLGRRSAHVPEDADHKEITNILCEVYPKMAELEGAWLIHKAMGRSGQRKLCVISPEEEGYSGASLVKAWGGKGCLYIMPIQQTLDTSPLALTAPEFESMPKARCMMYYKDVPLQLLTMHVQSCRPEQISGPELDVPFETHTDESDDDVQFLNTTEDNDNQRGLKQWARQKKASPQNTIIVSFIGENGNNSSLKWSGQLSQDFLKGTNGEKTQSTMCQHIRTTRSGTVERFLLLVQDAEEDSLMALTDRIIACGLLPILQQLRDGLALYGLDELLVEQPLMCQQLFVPGSLQGVDADFLILALSPEYSPEGSVREENSKESQKEDVNTCSDIKPPTVKTFCQWVTGQAHVPLGEAERSNFRVTVQFDHECHLKYGEHGVSYPIVNACSAAITIPTRHFEKASEFEVNMTEAILAGFEFNLH